jgi:hypothetical protein
MKRLNYLLFLSLAVFFPVVCVAWNPLGHMVIADIAYSHLNTSAKKQVDALVSYFHQEYPEMNAYEDIALWPDAVRSQHIDTFTHWHYSDNTFSADGTPLKDIKDTDNAVWALTNIQPIIKNKQANHFERARFLAFFTHIVADLHQPLHTVSRISQLHPDGDRGGNDYYVFYKNKRTNMHHVWDVGVGIFDDNPSSDKAWKLAQAIMSHYPESYFDEDQINNFNYEDWAKEGLETAKKTVYTVPEERDLDIDYVTNGSELAKQEAALAGYRLAVLLNKLLA